MINKQKLWFLTLFSLILVLSVYYVTMPSNLLSVSDIKEDTPKQKTKKSKLDNQVFIDFGKSITAD